MCSASSDELTRGMQDAVMYARAVVLVLGSHAPQVPEQLFIGRWRPKHGTSSP
jgi:hypothetical protein